MKIAVLGGSPKSNKNSITMQYVMFLQKRFPSHEFIVLNISRSIFVRSKDNSSFSKIIKQVALCDAVLWAFPVYIYLVPAQYKKFIELIFETKSQFAFRNKYAASFSTSIHAFDDLAHNYIAGICDDLNMNFVSSFSADMYDFFDSNKLKDLFIFLEYFLSSAENSSLTQKKALPLKNKSFFFEPTIPLDRIDPLGKKILVLADTLQEKTNIHAMCSCFSESFLSPPETVVLSELPIRNGCTGCLACGYNNVCPLPDTSVFTNLHSKISQADIIVFAGEIKDRFFSSLWKLFFDRSFLRGHPPNIFINKQIGFIFSGPLKYAASLSRFFNVFSETEKANLAGIVTDEDVTSDNLSLLLSQFAKRAVSFSIKKHTKPPSFLGFAGIKTCRDDIWGRHSCIFQSDFKNYKKLGLFDFPNKNLAFILYVRTIKLISKLPFFRRILYKNLPGTLSFIFRKLVK